MKAFVAKHWFLLLLIGGVTLAWWCPGCLYWSRWLDPRFVVVPALFLMAWTLESRSLFQALARPLPALWATLISYGGVPLLAWLLGRLLPDADFRIGLFVVATVPCTLASAVLWTRMAGGNEATALLVILMTTGTSWLATTAWLTWGTGAAAGVDTLVLMRGLVLVLVLPVGLGQVVRAINPLARAASRWKRPISVISQVLVLVILFKAAAEVGDKLSVQTAGLAVGALLATAVLCVGTHLTALVGGLWSSRCLGFDRPSRIAIAFACSQKTLPVALYLFDAYFKNAFPLAVVPMVFYHLGQLVVDTFIAERLASRPTREPQLAADAGL
jgi:sodium/bile acid cotransporter 7